MSLPPLPSTYYDEHDQFRHWIMTEFPTEPAPGYDDVWQVTRTTLNFSCTKVHGLEFFLPIVNPRGHLYPLVGGLPSHDIGKRLTTWRQWKKIHRENPDIYSPYVTDFRTESILAAIMAYQPCPF